MRTIAVVNQKGGCGKTITSINLSAFLAAAGRRVLLVDMDPQGHSTLGLTPGGLPDARTTYDVFLRGKGHSRTRLPDITRRVGENLDLAPADIRLSAIPESLVGVPGRGNILAEEFAGLADRYDYLIVDCPPTVGLLTFNALMACDEAIVPMEPSFFSLHGIGKLFETFQVLERQTGHHISARVLITQYAGRSSFVKAVVQDVRTHLAGEHYATIIRHSIKLAEAASHGLPVTKYAVLSAGFQDYQALAGEVLREERGPAVVASAPVVTRNGVRFAVEAPGALRVQLAGDFNGWTAEGNDMMPTGDLWTITVALAPGRYRYRFVIDGRWCSDPLNPEVEPTPFGGDDSVVVIADDTVVARTDSSVGTDDGSAVETDDGSVVATDDRSLSAPDDDSVVATNDAGSPSVANPPAGYDGIA